MEGTGISAEGKSVGFTYTPPPIQLFGRGLGVEERMLGYTTSSLPIDHFIAGYMSRMGALRAELNQSLDKDKSRRLRLGMTPLDIAPRPSASPVPYYPESFKYVPHKDASLKKLQDVDVPVTTYRRRQKDGKTQRLDVIPLGEIKPRMSGSTTRAIQIPAAATGGMRLSMLDKINIKVTRLTRPGCSRCLHVPCAPYHPPAVSGPVSGFRQ